MPSLLLEGLDLQRRESSSGGLLLDGVSLRLYGGDRIALVGATGSGKSVLLRALVCLDPIQGGQIRWQGRLVRGAEMPEFRGQVMLLPQRTALFEGTVAANLQLPFTLAQHHEMAWNRDRAVRQLTELELDGSFLEKTSENLSGGEAQVVALLRVLQLEPQVLLLDEPTAAVDRQTAARMETLIEKWQTARDERAFIWVTHDADQAGRVSKQRWQMAAGRIAFRG